MPILIKQQQNYALSNIPFGDDVMQLPIISTDAINITDMFFMYQPDVIFENQRYKKTYYTNKHIFEYEKNVNNYPVLTFDVHQQSFSIRKIDTTYYQHIAHKTNLFDIYIQHKLVKFYEEANPLIHKKSGKIHVEDVFIIFFLLKYNHAYANSKPLYYFAITLHEEVSDIIHSRILRYSEEDITPFGYSERIPIMDLLSNVDVKIEIQTSIKELYTPTSRDKLFQNIFSKIKNSYNSFFKRIVIDTSTHTKVGTIEKETLEYLSKTSTIITFQKTIAILDKINEYLNKNAEIVYKSLNEKRTTRFQLINFDKIYEHKNEDVFVCSVDDICALHFHYF